MPRITGGKAGGRAAVKAYAKASAPGIALLAALATGVTGCSGADAGTDGAGDAKSGESAAPAAPPGKYRTLPEPCRIVDKGTLKAMLPGVEKLPEEQQQKLFAGEPAVTYDTDRRVGCRWKAESPDATHLLTVDFERVVSYDSAVSDDDRAQALYKEQLDAADLPAPVDPPPASSAPPASSTGAATPPADSAGASGSPGAPDAAALQPRTLGGLGDDAFLDDVSAPGGSTAAKDRTVSVVFRTSNVIVSVKYGEQPGRPDQLPDGRALQDRAQALARKLAEQFSDSSE
ncbi:hypothetical protein GCM10010329_08490 [Streptomyces spiroverticillatus]|uniref:DUF3558 domain-containing protein n=1 Tax=Streptomyces finlayi TaxID=67296 RepID=A0A918WTG4_9ACTN|nr:DUF3558 domain-containing protein [Streptomyces finlayi]GGZ90163.1 hypothetical protein GCM10010329_08490 [Streptomyces spiroverticillatus]GHC81021.1 hypothetical protein GCM10010334_08480 [Streptomyces finlayi]